MSFPTDPEKAAIARQRMSDSAKKRFANIEARDKLTAIRLEAIRRPESRAKRSTKMKQHFVDHPEALEAMRERTLQQFSDPEARERHAELTIQQWNDPEKREAMLQGRRAFLNSPSSTYMRDRARETLAQTRLQVGYQEHVDAGMRLINSDPLIQQRRREGAIRAYQDPVKRENLRLAMQIVKVDPTWKVSTQAARKKVGEDPEYRQLVREQQTQRWQDEDYREKQLTAISKSMLTQGNSIERATEALLQALDIEYEAQKVIGWYIVDFYVPAKNLVIECDGDYWHSRPEAIRRDKAKNTYLRNRGYSLIRIPEHRIRAGDFTSIVECLA